MNRGTDSILSVYSDARTEYTKQLCVYLVPAYFQFFIGLLEKSKHTMSNEPKKMLWQLQTYLNEIHDWNMEKVNNEINIININCGCDYLEDLLTAVFIAHTKVLTAIRLSSNNKKVEITVPKVEHFLFKVLCETSKLLWGSTYLFRDGISPIEKQQNYRTIENILNEGVLLAIRNLVPVKSILKSFVNNDSTDDSHNVSNNSKDNTNDDDSDDDLDKKDTADINITKASDTEPNVPALSALPALPALPVLSASLPVSAALPAALPASAETHVLNNLITSAFKMNNTNSPNMTLPNLISLNEEPNEVSPPRIIIEDKPTVKFGEFNAMFDSEDPDNSDMIHQEENDEPVLEILDDVGTSLSSGLDFINLDEPEKDNTGEPEQMGAGDYEVL